MIQLNTETVIAFVRLRARMKELVEREKLDCDAIKEAMEAAGFDVFGPRESPYRLTRHATRQSKVDHEDMAKRAYRKLYGKEWAEQYEEDREAYGRKKVVSLTIDPNPRYKVNVGKKSI